MELVHSEIVRCVKATKSKSFHVATGHLLCQLGDEEASRQALDELFTPGYKEANDSNDIAAAAAAAVAAVAANEATTGSKSIGASFSSALFGGKPKPLPGGAGVAGGAAKLEDDGSAPLDAAADGKTKPPLPGGPRPPRPGDKPAGKPASNPKAKPPPGPAPAAPKVERGSSFISRGLSAVSNVTTKLFNTEDATATVRRKYFLSVQTHGLGGETGWGVTGPTVEKALLELCQLLDTTVTRLRKDQKKMVADSSAKAAGVNPNKRSVRNMKSKLSKLSTKG
jgi:hypothetical protein